MRTITFKRRRLALKGALGRLLAQFLLLMMMPWIPAYGGPRNEDPAAFRDGVVLISFRTDILQAQADSILAGVGANEIKRIGVGAHVLRVPPGRVLSTIQLLKSLDGIRYAEPDYLQTLAAGTLPNDTYIANQWAIQNNGQTVDGVTGITGADERLPAAWNVTTGTNTVVVAIVDTGVQYSHPDLLTNMWNNPGGIGGCPAGTHGYNVLTLTCDPMDDDTSYGGHGTHVSGIVGAVANNATGVAGVNWTTSIMAVKWVTSNSVGATSDLITAMDWVVNAKQAGVNVRVMNDSATWPGTGFSQALSDEIDLLGSNDILFVTAAGNTAQNNDTVPRYPCSYNRPNMICVAASDQTDNPWSSSNYGTTTVKLAAPGVNIYSTLRLSNYGYISGTSMASPQVAGTAALILSRGYASVASLITTILNNVDPLPSLSSYVSTGGRLNVCKAVPGCTGVLSGTPVNSSPPVVTGVPQYGSLVSASAGLWSGAPTQYRYQWYRCASDGTHCSQIQGATSQSYAILAQADIGATLGVAVTASNLSGSATTPSAASAIVSPASPPFAIASTILDGATVSGTLQWQATPAQQVNFVQFYVDGVLVQADSTSPYLYTLDSTTLVAGTHVFGIRALSNDNRTYGFYGATVTVTNATPLVNLVQSNAGERTGAASIPVSFLSANTAGNLIVVLVRMSSTSQTVTITDSTGNSYVDAVSQAQTSDGHQVHIFYAKNIKAGANTVTATFSATNNHPWLAIYEYSGLSTANPLDRTAHAQGSSTSPNSGASAITTNANELVFAAAGFPNSYSGTATAGGGYTLQQQDTGTSRAATETTIVTSTGTYAGTFTLSTSTNWSAVLATFVVSASGPGPPTITTNALPNGTSNTPYSTTVAATGGVTPYAWSILSGSLPPGLALGSSSGVISGTPSATGPFTFTAQVTDANGMTASKAFTLTINSGSASPIAMVQSNAGERTGAASVPVSFLSGNTAGNLIVVSVRMSSTSQTVTITDSAGNSYVDAVSQAQTSDGHQVHILYAKNIKAGANTVTATFSATNNHPWLAIYEYSGLSTANPLDRTAHAQGSSASPNSGASAITTTANELVFAAAGFVNNYAGTATVGSGYTLQQQDTGTSRAATETTIVTSTGTYAGTFTLSTSTNWSAVLATFQQ